ncbi:hypothetical protein ACTXT7_005078, partial [Hymenolepis weldensis]
FRSQGGKDRILRKFLSISQSDEKTAISCLNANNWKLESSLEFFYNRYSKILSDNKIEELYQRYCGLLDSEHPDRILATGMERFIVTDLKLNPASRLVLILAWKFGARTQGEFTKDEFFHGLHALECDSIESLQKRLPTLESEIEKPDAFKSLYTFTFGFANVDRFNAKSLRIDDAIAYMDLLLRGRFVHLDLWFKFLRASLLTNNDFLLFSFNEKNQSAISKDTWDLLLAFAKTIAPDFSDYDIEGDYDHISWERRGKVIPIGAWDLRNKSYELASYYTGLHIFDQVHRWCIDRKGSFETYKKSLGAWPVLIDEFVEWARPYGYVLRVLLFANCHRSSIDNYVRLDSLLVFRTQIYRQAQALLRKSANVNANNKRGFTPLHMASGQGHQRILCTLTDAGARWNVRASQKGIVPLNCTTSGSSVRINRFITASSFLNSTFIKMTLKLDLTNLSL